MKQYLKHTAIHSRSVEASHKLYLSYVPGIVPLIVEQIIFNNFRYIWIK